MKLRRLFFATKLHKAFWGGVVASSVLQAAYQGEKSLFVEIINSKHQDKSPVKKEKMETNALPREPNHFLMQLQS